MGRTLRQRLSAILAHMWELQANAPDDVIVQLGGGPPQPGWPAAVISLRRLWQHQPLSAKVRSLLTRSWRPSNAAITDAAASVFQQLFGGPEDYGPQLLRLCAWRARRSCPRLSSPAQDAERASALDAHGEVCRRQFAARLASGLTLELAAREPALCALVFPMSVKIPVVTMRYFICIDAHSAFDAVRSASHPQADSLIAYLYELLFLQHKTALALLDFAVHVRQAELTKGQAALTASELRGILLADLALAYLKASIEKTLALVAETHGITGLDSMKTHAAKLRALQRLPPVATGAPYGTLLLHMVQATELQELNDYRSGVFHKKGFARLQPHSSSIPGRPVPFARFLDFLLERHRRNSAALLAALALLSDELVRRQPLPDAGAVRAELAALMIEQRPFWKIHGLASVSILDSDPAAPPTDSSSTA